MRASNIIALLIISLCLLGFSLQTNTMTVQQPKTLKLIPMMRLLLADMQKIDKGIYTETYSTIADGAGSIADHPGMTPQDKKLIKNTLGKEMPKFVSMDMTVHHHADSIKTAAKQQNMSEVLRHYRIVQQGCVDCHSTFRQQIIDAKNQ